MRKFIFIWVSLLLIFPLSAQVTVNAKIIDSETLKPLPYCNVSIKGTNTGTITNEDGRFKLNVENKSSVLLCSYTGYEKAEIQVTEILKNNLIKLVPYVNTLPNFTVYGSDDYIYDIISSCVKQMKKHKSNDVAKLYFGLNSTANNQPVEILEMYYNCNVTNFAINNLKFKNGRFGVSIIDGRLFLSFNLSKILLFFNVLYGNDYLPAHILQLNKSQIKKRYYLECNTQNDNYYIKFYPKQNNHKYFSGEIWINKLNYDLLKMSLYVENTAIHPFVPKQFVGEDVCLNINSNFSYINDTLKLSSLDFKANCTYINGSGSAITPYNTRRDISIMAYCYDYGNPFIVPKFDYEENIFSDYQKLASIPYNPDFWDNTAYLLSENTLNQIGYIKREGFLVNFNAKTYYSSKAYGRHLFDPLNFKLNKFQFNSELFESDSTNYIVKGEGINYEHINGWTPLLFWEQNGRVVITKDFPVGENMYNDTVKAQPVRERKNTNMYYKLQTQILLDINPLNNTYKCKSYSVFNPKTEWKLPEDDYYNVFVNIYFDLVEIERRKMQEKIDGISNISLKQIDDIYNETNRKLFLLQEEYVNEVNMGKNTKKLLKWNNYIKDAIGIDNESIFNNK